MSRLPEWIRVRVGGLHETKRLLRRYGLLTVCEEAQCPNRGVCFTKPTATFMILGQRCTRNCGFCNVESAHPEAIDPEEPLRVAQAAKELGLRYVVITSVTRDDLPDGGASHFAATIRAVRCHLPGSRIEVLTPDFKGDLDAIKMVLESSPDVFNHNVETIPRLYGYVRPQADYERSLAVLKMAKAISGIKTKSGLMVGFGEKFEEVLEVMKDLKDAGCDYITIGQYLRPSKRNLPVREYVRPEVFERYRDVANDLGFKGIASGPLVRSSMNAEEMFQGVDLKG